MQGYSGLSSRLVKKGRRSSTSMSRSALPSIRPVQPSRSCEGEKSFLLWTGKTSTSSRHGWRRLSRLLAFRKRRNDHTRRKQDSRDDPHRKQQMQSSKSDSGGGAFAPLHEAFRSGCGAAALGSLSLILSVVFVSVCNNLS